MVLNAAHEARAGASAKPPADRLDGHLDGNGASPAQGRVLLVEDDVLIRMMTAEMLENIGLSVLEASSAGEALDILKDQLVDILLTDVGLPGISGIDLAARARSENPALRIVFATGNNSVPGLGERQRPRRGRAAAKALYGERSCRGAQRLRVTASGAWLGCGCRKSLCNRHDFD